MIINIHGFLINFFAFALNFELIQKKNNGFVILLINIILNDKYLEIKLRTELLLRNNVIQLNP